MTKMKRVAVIGAGPAGLCTARHLIHSNTNTKVSIKTVVFEQSDVVGGTWVYEDVDKDEKQEVFSSIYLNLKTNLPKQVMMFPDFPFPDHVPSFMHHTVVRKYLEDYAEHFDLNDYIRFNTSVIKVFPIAKTNGSQLLSNEQSQKWIVQSSNRFSDEKVEEEYDAVVVCNGHYSNPTYPTIKGLHHFSGDILHSHYYRRPSDFNGKDVLILGCGPSGVDILVELSGYCGTVYISHRGQRLTSVFPENVKECPNISYVNESGHFVFEDSSIVVVDAFIPCTGYTLNFPFITEECNVDIKDNTITNLYKHIFNIEYPSLSFVGLTWKNAPLPCFHQQCQYIMKVISEVKNLPSSEEMTADTEEERKERTKSGEMSKYFHRLGYRQWAYNRDIAVLAENKENPPIIENLYEYMSTFRRRDLWSYKNMEFKAINHSEFEDLSAA